MVLVVELVNVFVVCGSNDVYNVLMNFIACEIIAEFDDFVYKALPKGLINRLEMTLLVKHTSSTRYLNFLGEKVEDTSSDDPKTYTLKEDNFFWVGICK